MRSIDYCGTQLILNNYKNSLENKFLHKEILALLNEWKPMCLCVLDVLE